MGTTTRVKGEMGEKKPFNFALFWDKYGTFFILAIIVAIFGTLSSEYFLTTNNITQIFVQSSVTVLIGMGEFFAILVAGIDLSVGAILALSGMVTAKLMLAGVDPFLAALIGGVLVGGALADEPGYAQINTADAERLGIEDEALVWVNSRKGRIITRAQVSDRPNKGAVYMTYQWWIGACNELVSENLSPITKTPEYKYCAVNVEPIADQRAAEQYVIDEYNKLKTRLRESAMG